MQLTGIGEENLRTFRALMSGLSLEDHDIAQGVIEDGEAAGVALFNKLGDALMLDYIFVAKPFRRRGIGRTLITETLAGSGGVRPAALHVNYPEQARDLHLFFRSLGFFIFRDGISWKVPAKTILESPSFRKLIASKHGAGAKPISSLTLKELNGLKKSMTAMDYDPDILDDRRVSDELCLASADPKSGRPVACMLCEQEDKQIVILFLINFSQDVSQLVDLFRTLNEVIESRGLADNDLLFVTMNEKMEDLARMLTGKDGELSMQGKVISAILMGEENADAEAEEAADQRLVGVTASADNRDETEERFALRALSKSQRHKRGIRFNEKARLQSHMYTAMVSFADTWNETPSAVSKLPDTEKKFAIFGTYSIDGYDRKAFLDRDVYTYNRYHEDRNIEGADENEIAGSIIRCLEETDLGRFDYQTDTDFVRENGEDTFGARFAALRLLAHCEDFLKDGSGPQDAADGLGHKAAVVTEVLADYEYRALLLQSPFYTLLADKDFDSLPDKDLQIRIKQTEHEGAREYLKHMLERRKKIRFTRGVSAAGL